MSVNQISTPSQNQMLGYLAGSISFVNDANVGITIMNGGNVVHGIFPDTMEVQVGEKIQNPQTKCLD